MTIDLTPTARRATSLAGLCDGAVHLPGDPGYDAARHAVERRRRPAPRRRRAAPHRRRRRRTSSAPRPPPACGSPRRAPATTPARSSRTASTTSSSSAPSGCAASPSTPTRRIARVEGGALWMRRDRARRRPRPRRPARHLARRRHRRLQPRRRHRLVRPQARPGRQQPHRRRARHRRRRARPRRRDAEPRALLGAARRRRQLRRRHGARVPPLPDRDGVRRHAGLGPRPGRAGAAPLGRLGARGARRGHHVVPLPATCRRCRRSRSRCAAGRSSSSTARCSAATREARAILAAAARRCGPEIDTFDRVPARSLVRLHMDPEGPTPGRLGRRRCSASSPTPAIDAFLEQVGPGSTSSLLVGRAAPARRCAGPRARGPRRPRDARRGSTPPSPSRSRRPRRWRCRGSSTPTRLTGALEPWSTGRSYLNFAENAVDARTGYDRVGVAAAQGDPVGLRPRRPVPRQPPRPAPLRGRPRSPTDPDRKSNPSALGSGHSTGGLRRVLTSSRPTSMGEDGGMTHPGYDVDRIRWHFPALREGAAHFDGPGGSQVPDTVAHGGRRDPDRGHLEPRHGDAGRAARRPRRRRGPRRDGRPARGRPARHRLRPVARPS